MARRRNYRKRNGFTIPLGVVAGIAVPTALALNEKTWQQKVTQVSRSLIGYRPWAGTFDFRDLKMGLLPILMGIGVHKVAGMLGINRVLASSGLPVIRI